MVSKYDADVLSKLSDKDRRDIVEGICIKHPQFNEVFEKLEYCREQSKAADEAIGILVTGEPGMGKTTIINRYLAQNTRYQTDKGMIVPVVAGIVPSTPTVHGMATALLDDLGDPFPTRGTQTIKSWRLKKLVDACQSEIILFDEFQHFMEESTARAIKSISDWTKNYMNQTKRAIALFGTPEAAAVLDAKGNSQLRRRFPFRIKLVPFGWDTDKQKENLRKFLYKLDEELPFPEVSNLSDPEMAQRIFQATKGNINAIMKLCRRAAVLAIDNEQPSVEKLNLHQAFDDILSKIYPDIKNPFKK